MMELEFENKKIKNKNYVKMAHTFLSNRWVNEDISKKTLENAFKMKKEHRHTNTWDAATCLLKGNL